MKKFLLLSHYAPKPGFKYPEHDCPLAHRATAHQRVYALDRFWPEGVLWHTLEVENTPRENLLDAVKDTSWDAVWLSGSPYLMHEAQAHPWINNALEATSILIQEQQNPTIGLCFGLQLMAKAVGAEVKATDEYIIGETDILDAKGEKLIRTKAYHKNYVTNLPPQAEIFGWAQLGYPYYVQFAPQVFGVQSHPECSLQNQSERQAAEIFWKNQFHQTIG